MKVVLWCLVLSIALAGCSLSPTPDSAVTSSVSDADFEDEHADDMQDAMDESLMLSGTISSTLELLQPEQEVDIATEAVIYFEDVEWFLAYPQDDLDAPGIVMIHERRWLNEHIQDMARVLAMQGYRVLAVDLYEGEVASGFDDARRLSSSLDNERALEHLLAAESYLRLSTDSVASLWWCLWWAQSLNLSIASDTLDATVVYYGRLPEDMDRLAGIRQPFLGIFAAEDESIPPASVASFQSSLDELGLTAYDITVYSGVWHAFANPTGNNFAREQTMDAWEQTLSFLDEVLR